MEGSLEVKGLGKKVKESKFCRCNGSAMELCRHLVPSPKRDLGTRVESLETLM